MIILGIETSCDETSIAVVKTEGGAPNPSFHLISHSLHSQIDIHKQYGGVFPQEARRAHAANITPILAEALENAHLAVYNAHPLDKELKHTIKELLHKEPELFDILIDFVERVEKPAINAIAVTIGPGLPPALWVGVNFARALSLIWDIPIVGCNHMKGHIVSVLMSEAAEENPVQFPAISLLISGGHTELVYMKDADTTEKIGQTRDDAVGEAFDKVARMMGLSYPGGPLIGKLAHEHRQKFPVSVPLYPLPRPMIHTDDFDFSFSGIKTAVLYTLKDIGEITDEIRSDISREFETAVTEVLIAKTKKALDEYEAKSIIIGGGVTASTYIREQFKILADSTGKKLYVPDRSLSTDNAVMIAIAGYKRIQHYGYDDPATLSAQSNMSL